MEFFLRQVYPWLIEVAAYSALIPFVAGLLLFRKSRSLPFRLLFLYVSLIVLSEVLGTITVSLGVSNNLWLVHLFTLFEFLLLAYIYYISFSSSLFRKGIWVAVAVFLTASFTDAFVLEGVNQMNSQAKVIGNTLLMLAAILYFYKVANDQTTTYLDRDPIFLLSCALLISKAGTTMSYVLFNEALATSYDAARICIAITLVLNVLYCLAQVLVLKRAAA